MKLDRAIEDLQAAEVELAKRLRTVGERHAAEHDLYHLGHALARGCADRLARLGPMAQRYGTATDPDRAADSGEDVDALRRKGSQLLGRTEVAGQLMLSDLRQLYVTARAAEIAWVILLQAAKAARDRDLIELASHCHEEAETCATWVRTRIKESAPQVLAVD
jgi:hypothetical protein